MFAQRIEPMVERHQAVIRLRSIITMSDVVTDGQVLFSLCGREPRRGHAQWIQDRLSDVRLETFAREQLNDGLDQLIYRRTPDPGPLPQGFDDRQTSNQGDLPSATVYGTHTYSELSLTGRVFRMEGPTALH